MRRVDRPNRAFLFAPGLLLTLSAAVFAQPFQNLDFEDIQIVNVGHEQPAWVVTDVPGWTFSWHDPPQLAWNIAAEPQQYLLNYLEEDTSPPLEGQFSAAMETAPDCNFGDCDTPIAPFISQTGLVPGGTQSIRVLASDPRPYVLPGEAQEPMAWFLSLGGVEIPMFELAPGYFSGDATAFAGDVAELKIGLNADYVALSCCDIPMPLYSFGGFDAIQFSSLPFKVLPEPVMALSLVLCVASLLFRRRS